MDKKSNCFNVMLGLFFSYLVSALYYLFITFKTMTICNFYSEPLLILLNTCLFRLLVYYYYFVFQQKISSGIKGIAVKRIFSLPPTSGYYCWEQGIWAFVKRKVNATA